METKMESNSILPFLNEEVCKESMENEDDSFTIPETLDLNELENTNNGNESEKSVSNYETEVHAGLLIEQYCMSGSPYNNVASEENKVISCKNNGTRDFSTDTGIKTSLRHTECKSYVESDIENNGYSSSDEEVVLQSRICNEEGKAISNVPEGNSTHTGEDIEPTYDESNNFNKFCNDNSDYSNLENEQHVKLDLLSGEEVNTIIAGKESNQNIDFNAMEEKETACIEISLPEKIKPKNKIATETSSFELSSLSEAGDDELLTNVCKNSSNEKKIYKNDTSSLHAEIIQRCLDISSEVHSICDDMETSETSTLNVIVNDFFSGTLDINKYELNKISPNNTTIFEEMHKTKQNGMKIEKNILNNRETYLSIPETPESLKMNTNSEDKQTLVNNNKSTNNKSLKTKQIKKDESTIRNKKLPTVHLTKNYLNDQQKNKVHVAKKLKSCQSFNRQTGNKIINEDPLPDGKLNYLKQDTNNKTAIKSTKEAMIDKSLHKTSNKMKQGNSQRYKALETCIIEGDKLKDLSCSTSFKDNLFDMEEMEPQKKRIENDNKKDKNRQTSKIERKVSLKNKAHLFADESDVMKQGRLTSKHLTNNSPFKNTRVRQISNDVSADINKHWETNKEQMKLEVTKPQYTVENENVKKRPKTWDDLEKLMSNEINYDSYTYQDCYEGSTSTSKKATETDENTSNAVTVCGVITTNQQNKKARVQTDALNDFAVSNLLQNKDNSTILKKNSVISPKTVSKRKNELALISPNANIINKIMKNMEKCTRPYLTTSQERQKTSLKDSEANYNSNKSPIVTEYSYSIKEIQSTMCFTAGKTNSEKQITNLIQSDTKTRLCKISHKKVLNKNYNVQTQETTLKASSKDRCDGKPLTSTKSDVSQLVTKQQSKKENESKTSKENTKHNVLDNILARLKVDPKISDSQRDNNYVGNKTKFLKKGNIRNKKPTKLETSISPMESISLSPDQVEQGHYNLRKRKSKNYMEELDNHQSSEKDFDFHLQSSNSTITKQSTDWNDENAYDTDSSCEIIDIPKQKSNKIKVYQNGKQIKTVEIKNEYSKSKNSSRPLLKKKETEFGKKVTRNFQEPLNSSDDSNVDTDGSIYEVRDLVSNPIVKWIEYDTLDKNNIDSSCDILDFTKGSKQLKRKQNRNQSKITEIKDSKSDLSKYPSLNKKKIKGLEKFEEFPTKTKSCKSLNNGTTNCESKNGHLGKLDKYKNMFKKDNESKATSPYSSNKIPQTDMKITTKKNHLYSGKERAFHHDFLQEKTNLSSSLQVRSSSRQNLDKSYREDNYKKYLESIFKNSNQKTSTPQIALSTIQKQEQTENTLIEDSEENDELFSLSSSDSEDCEMTTRKKGLGLLDDTLCRADDDEEE